MMRKLDGIRLTLILAASAVLPGALTAQQQGQDQRAVTLQEVKDRLKENEKHLEEARKRGRAGDAAGLQVALENYGRNMEGLDRALANGRFEGDEFGRLEALERVDKATRKHGEVLADLLNKVPDQAKPAIEKAMQVSAHGRETALGNLAQARAERDIAVARREQARRQDNAGRPETIGQPSGIGRAGSMGGPPSGGGRPSPGPSGSRSGGRP